MRSKPGRVICLCHDVERGLGHRDSNPPFAESADRLAPRHLADMLAIEAEAGVRATYHVVGQLLPGLLEPLARAGHAVGFHSYDHRIDDAQLARCRQVSADVKGYRPPRSRLTPELTDGTLAALGFEWLASSARSLQARLPCIERGVVKIPIHLDDYALYARGTPYDEWEEAALDVVATQDFACLSLHDCYGQYWLPHYRRLLARVTSLGDLRTLDEVVATVRGPRPGWGAGTRD